MLIGPYYAMFPTRFADAVIKKHTLPGDTVLDPFAGRGTAIFSAAALGRRGFGVEISPVGWIYAKAKLGPAPLVLHSS
jgi:DNA modification methylase